MQRRTIEQQLKQLPNFYQDKYRDIVYRCLYIENVAPMIDFLQVVKVCAYYGNIVDSNVYQNVLDIFINSFSLNPEINEDR